MSIFIPMLHVMKYSDKGVHQCIQGYTVGMELDLKSRKEAFVCNRGLWSGVLLEVLQFIIIFIIYLKGIILIIFKIPTSSRDIFWPWLLQFWCQLWDVKILPTHQIILRSLGVLQSNPLLTPSTWRQHTIPETKGSLSPTRPHPSSPSQVSPGYTCALTFWF